MQIIKKKKKNIVPHVYEQRLEHPQFIREEYRPGVGMVALFTDGEVVVDPHPDYKRSCKLIDAIFNRKRSDYCEIKAKNILDYVA